MQQNPGFGGIRLGDCRLASRYITGTRRQKLAENSGIYGLYIQLDCFSVAHTRIINLPSNQKGYVTSETTVGKLLARRIQI